MSTENSELWARAYKARDKLVEQFLEHPEVTLIDISSELEKGKSEERIVLRVHVRQPAAKQALGLPEEIDGIPVRVMTGDYRLE